jgi:hypothetical protein
MSTTTSQANTIRTDVWSKEIQEELQEELMAQRTVDFVSDFGDGDELHIPTFSSVSVSDYTENTDIAFEDPTTGEFTLTIDEYLQAGVSITDKLKEDSFYVSEIQSKFPKMCVRALMERLENDIFLLHKGQTTNDANTINGVAHRYVGTGTSTVIALADIIQAREALTKANVSRIGRQAYVDASVSSELLTLDAIIRQDVYGQNANIKEGFGSTAYIGRYMGFDFYESNMLDEATALDHDAGGSLKANIFIGEEAFKGAIRSMPDIEYFRNAGKKRDEYSANLRYGLGNYRLPALVTILTA